MTDQDNLREWEHNHETTEHFAFTGGTEMTSQDELRDRISSVVAERNAYFGGHTGRADPKDVAQAIIDEFGLTVEERLTEYGIDDPGYEYRVVGKWEAEE